MSIYTHTTIAPSVTPVILNAMVFVTVSKKQKLSPLSGRLSGDVGNVSHNSVTRGLFLPGKETERGGQNHRASGRGIPIKA